MILPNHGISVCQLLKTYLMGKICSLAGIEGRVTTTACVQPLLLKCMKLVCLKGHLRKDGSQVIRGSTSMCEEDFYVPYRTILYICKPEA